MMSELCRVFGTVLYTAAWRRNAAAVRNDIASYDAVVIVWSGVPCVDRSRWGPL